MASDQLAPVQLVTFKVMSEPYERTFLTALRRALVGDRASNPDNTVVGPISKIQRPVLAKETATKKEPYKQPPRWIHVVLTVVGEDGKTIKSAPKVAIRSDNAYICGFTNSKGDWFQLSKTGTKVNLVNDKNVTMVGFGVSYSELVDKQQGINALPVLNLSKNSTAKAAGKLWNHTAKKLYDDDDMLAGNPNDDLKKAIATLCVVLCEAARFTPVSEVINKGWGRDRVSITAKEISYMKEWGDLSTNLLKWKEAGYKGDKELFKDFAKIGIDDGEKALAVVQLVKLINRSRSLLAWLKYFLGLLVKKLQQVGTTVYAKPKGSALVSPL